MHLRARERESLYYRAKALDDASVLYSETCSNVLERESESWTKEKSTR